MKYKILIALALSLLLASNTNYWWSEELAYLAFPAYLLLFGLYLILLVIWVYQVIGISGREMTRLRLRQMFTVLIVLVLVTFRPMGYMNPEWFESKDLLIAYSEGGGNCNTTLRFKENNKFIERVVCFGVGRTDGNYIVRRDTVFISEKQARKADGFKFKFLVLKTEHDKNNKTRQYFAAYDNDNQPYYGYQIFKNELIKPYYHESQKSAR